MVKVSRFIDSNRQRNLKSLKYCLPPSRVKISSIPIPIIDFGGKLI